MSFKNAAEELLKVADEIEKEASEVTQFVCDNCNHTATLATINSKRREAAEQAEENVTVSDITVNDQVACPACDGQMAYKATEESAPYYFDPEKQAEEKEGASCEKKDSQEEEEEEKKASEPIDYDSFKRYSAA